MTMIGSPRSSTRFFPPLLLVSLLALGLFAAWHQLYGPWTGPRLHLNLALAWAPYLFALWAAAWYAQDPLRTRRLALPGFLWLIFFPNAPYLITDWLYLPGFTQELWYSIALLTTFSMAGILLTIVSLYLMHTMFQAVHGRVAGWSFVFLALLLSGVGVYMGRFLRLNSWELITHPAEVLQDVLQTIEQHRKEVNPFRFSLMFAAMLAVFYLVFWSLRRSPQSPEELDSWGDASAPASPTRPFPGGFR